jgi:hypothetical protein
VSNKYHLDPKFCGMCGKPLLEFETSAGFDVETGEEIKHRSRGCETATHGNWTLTNNVANVESGKITFWWEWR